jgi:hypothetical protein
MVNDDVERRRFSDLQAVDLAMARLMADGFVDGTVVNEVFDIVHWAANNPETQKTPHTQPKPSMGRV